MKRITITLLLTLVFSTSHAWDLFKIEKEHGRNWIYLDGEASPVGLPHKTFVSEIKISNNRETIAFSLSPEQGYYYGLLIAKKENGSWVFEYQLLESELLLYFGKRAWVKRIVEVDNYPEVIVEMGVYEKRTPPSKVKYSMHYWDFKTGAHTEISANQSR